MQVGEMSFQVRISKKSNVVLKVLDHEILQVRPGANDDVNSVLVVDDLLASGLAHENGLDGIVNNGCGACL